jgi:uncharacterized protein YbcI
METTAINNYQELLFRLNELKAEKIIQDVKIRYSIREFITGFDLVSLFHKGSDSTGEQSGSFAKPLFGFLLNLFSGYMLNKQHNIKSYVGAMLVKMFTDFLLSNNMISLISGISSIIKKRRNSKKED